ncbi:MAG: hypothetical protein ED555_01530 [Allomuricauda sp.]|nr:MAG: hypothetical protein ED555_01530 [Allomuricauda sp.]
MKNLGYNIEELIKVIDHILENDLITSEGDKSRLLYIKSLVFEHQKKLCACDDSVSNKEDECNSNLWKELIRDILRILLEIFLRGGGPYF